MIIRKFTVQVMYRILIPKLQDFLKDRNQDFAYRILGLLSFAKMNDLMTLLCTTEFKGAMAAFVESRNNPKLQILMVIQSDG